MRSAALPLLFVALVGAVIGGLFLLRGDPDRSPRGDGPPTGPEAALPAALAGEDADRILELRERVRDALGADAAALDDLRKTMPADPAVRVEWLRFLQSDFELAIRSNDAAAGASAIRSIAASLDEPGGPIHSFVTDPAFRATWQRALEAETPEPRAAAIRLLGELGGEARRARAAPALDDEAPAVRIAAVEVYHRLGGSPARLVALHRREEDTDVRKAILEAFASCAAPRPADVTAIEARAIRSGTDAERILAMESLARHRDHDALDAVLPNLDSAATPVRRVTISTLAHLKDRRALEPLRAYITREKDPELVAFAKKVSAGLE